MGSVRFASVNGFALVAPSGDVLRFGDICGELIFFSVFALDPGAVGTKNAANRDQMNREITKVSFS
jgi:hypothetical protein